MTKVPEASAFYLRDIFYFYEHTHYETGDIFLWLGESIFSEEVKGDALKFKNYLLTYFDTNKESDPQKLFSYKPTNRELKYTKLIATRKDNKIAMLDGSHRLTEMLLSDTKEVHIFVGHPVEGIPEESKKTLIGNSTLILLTILYKQGNEEENG